MISIVFFSGLVIHHQIQCNFRSWCVYAFISSVFACSFPYCTETWGKLYKICSRRVSNLKKAHKLHDMGVLGFVFQSMTASLNFPLLCFFFLSGSGICIKNFLSFQGFSFCSFPLIKCNVSSNLACYSAYDKCTLEWPHFNSWA